ncbi:hypothetical protein E2C01_062754 [Portunus trituberculatus]|uniref:Uncharacterized protein n=1 Tax=Portunus trituberculatus TaxID=210409 RepID=A0A5B7HBY7_PORTR|nr:hypothetical protein [Portunus trituberculatus]
MAGEKARRRGCGAQMTNYWPPAVDPMVSQGNKVLESPAANWNVDERAARWRGGLESGGFETPVMVRDWGRSVVGRSAFEVW